MIPVPNGVETRLCEGAGWRTNWKSGLFSDHLIKEGFKIREGGSIPLFWDFPLTDFFCDWFFTQTFTNIVEDCMVLDLFGDNPAEPMVLVKLFKLCTSNPHVHISSLFISSYMFSYSQICVETIQATQVPRIPAQFLWSLPQMLDITSS